MTVRPRGIMVFTCIAAAMAFCGVQDYVTNQGARRYVELQRAAMAGQGPAVTIDEIMHPAVVQSVREGLLWGGVVMATGWGAARIIARRGRTS